MKPPTSTPGEFAEINPLSRRLPADYRMGFPSQGLQNGSQDMIDFQDYLEGNNLDSSAVLAPAPSMPGGTVAVDIPVRSRFGNRGRPYGQDRLQGGALSESEESRQSQGECVGPGIGFDLRASVTEGTVRGGVADPPSRGIVEEQGSPTSLLQRAPNVRLWENAAWSRAAVGSWPSSHVQMTNSTRDLQGSVKRHKVTLNDDEEPSGQVPVLHAAGGLESNSREENFGASHPNTGSELPQHHLERGSQKPSWSNHSRVIPTMAFVPRGLSRGGFGGRDLALEGTSINEVADVWGLGGCFSSGQEDNTHRHQNVSGEVGGFLSPMVRGNTSGNTSARLDGVPEVSVSDEAGNDDAAVPKRVDICSNSSCLDPSGSARLSSFAIGASGSTGIGGCSGSGMGSSGISEVEGSNVGVTALGVAKGVPWEGLKLSPSGAAGWGSNPASGLLRGISPRRGTGGVCDLTAGGPEGSQAKGLNYSGVPAATLFGIKALSMSRLGCGSGGRAKDSPSQAMAGSWVYSNSGRKLQKGLLHSTPGAVGHEDTLWLERNDETKAGEVSVKPSEPTLEPRGLPVYRVGQLAGSKRPTPSGADGLVTEPSPEGLTFAEVSSQELEEAQKALVEGALGRSLRDGRWSGSSGEVSEKGKRVPALRSPLLEKSTAVQKNLAESSLQLIGEHGSAHVNAAERKDTEEVSHVNFLVANVPNVTAGPMEQQSLRHGAAVENLQHGDKSDTEYRHSQTSDAVVKNPFLQTHRPGRVSPERDTGTREETNDNYVDGEARRCEQLEGASDGNEGMPEKKDETLLTASIGRVPDEAGLSLPDRAEEEANAAANVSAKEKTSCDEGAGSTGLERTSTDHLKMVDGQKGLLGRGKKRKSGSLSREEDTELKRRHRERRREERRRDDKKREERQLAEAAKEKGQSSSRGRETEKDGKRDQWSGSRDKKSRKNRSDGTSKGFSGIKHFASALSPRKSIETEAQKKATGRAHLLQADADAARVETHEKETLPGFGSFRGWVKAVQKGKACRPIASATGGFGPESNRNKGVGGDAGGKPPGREAEVPLSRGPAGAADVAPVQSVSGDNPDNAVGEIASTLVSLTEVVPALSSLQGQPENRVVSERIAGDGPDVAADVGERGRRTEEIEADLDGNTLEREVEHSGPDAPFPASAAPPRRAPRVHSEDVVVPGVQSGSGGTDEQALGGGDSEEHSGHRVNHEVQVVPSTSRLWSEQGEQIRPSETEGQSGGGVRTERMDRELEVLAGAMGRQQQQRVVSHSRQACNAIHDRQSSGGWAAAAANGWQGRKQGLHPQSPALEEGPSGTTGTGTMGTATGSRVPSGSVPGIPAASGGGPTGGAASGSTSDGRLRDRWIGRFIGSSGKAFRGGGLEPLEGIGQIGDKQHFSGSNGQGQSILGQGPLTGSDKLPEEYAARGRGSPVYNSYLRYKPDVQNMSDMEKLDSARAVRMAQGLVQGPFLRGPLGRPCTEGLIAHLPGPVGGSGNLIGTMGSVAFAQRETADDGSGEECLMGLGAAEYAASMAALRAWRLEGSRSREEILKEYDVGGNTMGQMSLAGSAYLALNTRTPGLPLSFGQGQQLVCPFCNLPGHPLVLCSETRDCELPGLVKRAGSLNVNSRLKSLIGLSSSLSTESPSQLPLQMLQEGSRRALERTEIGQDSASRGEELQEAARKDTAASQPLCLRCLEAGHWGVECSLTCSEAAAKAQDKERLMVRLRSTNPSAREKSLLGSNNLSVASEQRGNSTASRALSAVCESCSLHGLEEGSCVHMKGRARYSEVEGWAEKSPSKSSSPAELVAGAQDRGYQKSVKPGCENDWRQDEEASRQSRDGRSFAWERRRLKDDVLEADGSAGKSVAREREGQPAVKQEQAAKVGGSLGTTCDGAELPKGVTGEPADLLEGIESIRLPRRDLLKWADSPEFAEKVKGFFLRLRFGKKQEVQGGTGYRMARLTGASRKQSGGETVLALAVDFGDGEYTVDGQYVSNKQFTEVELLEWWKGASSRKRLMITRDEIDAKFQERQSWFP